MKKAAIGIDVGGTKISVVLGTEKGKVLARKVFSTPLRSKSKEALVQLRKIIFDFLLLAKIKKIRVQGIGVGLPGAVNPRSGKVPPSPNLPGWANLPIRSKLQALFSLPIYLANDANAAACAEKVFGTAKKCSDFVYVTVSTGLGSGIFVDGKLVEGAGFSAGEIGHIPVQSNGNACLCGRRGCLEAHASGTAIAKEYTNLSRKKVNGAKDVALAALNGDAKALKAFEIASYHLGTGLVVLMNTLNPQMIVLGGGVFKSAPASFLQKAIQRSKKIAWPEAARSCQVKKSILKNAAGDLGALALVFLNQKKT